MKAFIYLITLLFLSSILAKETSSNSELEIFFNKWREFESPPLSNNVPDYTRSQFKKRQRSYKKLKKELMAFDTSGWKISWRADWQLIEAEMNGYDFNRRVLKPWERDPAFYQTIWMYQSDVPAHEGPTNHALLEFWQYNFPLNEDSLNKLTNELSVIPPFLIQARENLSGNAKDLWIAGIRDIETQLDDLNKINKIISSYHDETDNPELFDALKKAKAATELFTKWLKKESPKKNGPSGIGKDNYTWYQKNVHLIPLSWEEEVQLLKRELNRAWSSLKLEEHRNRNLPKLKSAQTEEEFNVLTERSINKMMKFLTDENIMYIKPNMEPALREHRGIFIESEKRNFFYIGMHIDPLPLYSHFYHWFDLAEIRDNPHKNPIRRAEPLYNMFDSKNEGIATAVEEIFMHAGLYDDNPRSREIVWIMLAQRAARGLGSLYAHANMMNMEEASQVHVKWTPRGWMEREPELLRFEQHLYLRQPGYGTCYITGKYLVEDLMMEYAEKLETDQKDFILKDFLNKFNMAGSIPVELIRFELMNE